MVVIKLDLKSFGESAYRDIYRDVIPSPINQLPGYCFALYPLNDGTLATRANEGTNLF